MGPDPSAILVIRGDIGGSSTLSTFDSFDVGGHTKHLIQGCFVVYILERSAAKSKDVQVHSSIQKIE